MSYYYFPDAYRCPSPPERPRLNELAKALLHAESTDAGNDCAFSDEELRKARRKIAYWASENLLRQGADGEMAQRGPAAKWEPDSAHRIQRICQLQRESNFSLKQIKAILDAESTPQGQSPQVTTKPAISKNNAFRPAGATPEEGATTQRVYKISDGISLVVDDGLPPGVAGLVPMLVRAARSIIGD